jgi:glycosyltransferase involved in cell wall biosynthesis
MAARRPRQTGKERFDRMPGNPSPSEQPAKRPLTVAWISEYSIEWVPDIPDELKHLPRRHPATWEIVLLDEFVKDPRLKIHVVLLRHRIKRSVSFERHGATFHVLKGKPWMRLASAFFLDTILIRRLLRHIQPDLVHAWGNEKAAGWVADRLGRPYLVTIQGLFGWYKERVPMSRYDLLMERVERISLSRAPVATTESTFAVGYLKQRFPNLQVVQAEHAPNRVFRNVQRQPQTQPLHFISIAGLGHRKGTDLLFQALDKLCKELSFKLTVISLPNPDYLKSLRASVSEELWSRVEFKHHLLPDQVARELETPTMLIFPTRADTSPNAVKESVVAGLPVVASNVGGIPDYVFPGRNGVLCEPGNVESLIQGIRTACAHPLLSQGKVAPETLAQTREYLSPERMAQNFMKAYNTALNAARVG